jgi:hypothetical protein
VPGHSPLAVIPNEEKAGHRKSHLGRIIYWFPSTYVWAVKCYVDRFGFPLSVGTPKMTWPRVLRFLARVPVSIR